MRYEHMLFGLYPVEVDYTVDDAPCAEGCAHLNIRINGIFDQASGEQLNIAETQDIFSYFQAKIGNA